MLTARNPDRTREALLQAAFEEIHRHGFQAASLSRILIKAGVTKGALYHHFPSKIALGYAVVEEVILPQKLAEWVAPMQTSDDPLPIFRQLLQRAGEELCADPERILLGCPLNNLAQEMSPIDEGFRQRLNAIFALWQQSLTAALQRGQAAGTVRAEVDADAAAGFILAAIEGCIGMAKHARAPELLMRCGGGLLQYLDSLRVNAR